MEKIFKITDRDVYDIQIEQINSMLNSGWSVKSVTMTSSDGEFFTIVVLEKN